MKKFILEKLRYHLTENIDNFKQFLIDLNFKTVSGKKNIFFFEMNNSRIYIKYLNKNTIELELIETPDEFRGLGSGKPILKHFLEIVDKYRFNVELIVSPRDKKTNAIKLNNFYKSFGFEFKSMNGFKSDFEMVRYRR